MTDLTTRFGTDVVCLSSFVLVCPRLSSFVLPCWGRETGERPTIYLRGGTSVTSLVTPASRFALFTSVCCPSKSGVVWTVGWLAVFRLPWEVCRGSDGKHLGERETWNPSKAMDGFETWHGHVVYLCLCSPRFGCWLDCRLACCVSFTLDPGPLTF